jgi:hypothetical protein
VTLPSAANAETIYFLVGPPPNQPVNDTKAAGTVVIPITDPLQISHARGLLAGREKDAQHPLVYVRVGKNGINRNYFEPTLPEWSWHPFQLIRFGDVFVDGIGWTPGALERSFHWSDPAAWNEARPVGFPSMSIIRELGPAPVFLSATRDGIRLHLSWNLVENTPASFTLLQTESLANPLWQPVPGATNLATNTWSSDLGSGQGTFYRVAVTLP